MFYLIGKVLLSAIIIVSISELAKRSTFFGALLASLPLTSVLAMIWLYFDTQNGQEVAQLAHSILWLILPSLVLFLLLPILIKTKMNFYLALTLSLAAMVTAYFLMALLLKKLGVKF